MTRQLGTTQRHLYLQFQNQDVGCGGFVGIMESDVLRVLQVLE